MPEFKLALAPLSADDSLLHERAVKASLDFRHAEAELMESLIAIGTNGVFRRLGYPSLYQYARDALFLSEAVAFNAVAVARKAEAVPALREAVTEGRLGLSKAKKVLSVLNPRAGLEAQSVWVEKAVTLTSRELEKQVAAENPKAAVAERAIYRAEKRLELRLGVSEELMLEFRQAQNLVSNTRGHEEGATLEETLNELVKFYLAKRDPGRKARRIIAKKGTANANATHESSKRRVTKPRHQQAAVQTPEENTPPSQFTGTVVQIVRPRRTPIPAKVLHFVRHRDDYACRARLPDGKLCLSRRWLDIHHLIRVRDGGTHATENLITLCREHHRQHHRGPTFRVPISPKTNTSLRGR